MCVYCMIADFGRNAFPWYQRISDPLAVPLQSPNRLRGLIQEQQKLTDLEAILARVKEMQSIQGCSCEDEQKTDYLPDMRRRLDSIEKTLRARYEVYE